MANVDKFIAGEYVWATLRTLAKRVRGKQKFVATGYLGDGAGDLLELGRGDVLVVALSKSNAKSGSVSPKEVRRLRNRGVEVFVDVRLHAKVYLFGDTLVVGSANLSKHSMSTLHEACLVSHDTRAVRMSREWFQGFRVPVTPERLAACLAVYRPPRFAVARDDRAKSEGRHWLVGIRPMKSFPGDEADVCRRGQEDSKTKVGGGYKVEPLRFAGSRSQFTRQVKPGDFVIQVWNDGRSRDVYPFAEIVGIGRTRNRRGTRVVYVHVATPLDPKLISWPEFKRGMAAVGVSLGRDVSTREIHGPAIERARALLR